ncbi:hypothetical protein GCM10027168_63380 [Streptomyces capparidis]
MLYRSRRLEALFGSPLDSVSYGDLAALIGKVEAAEAEDLDYKQEAPTATQEQKAEFAKDVAAFANHIGGVLVIGMADVRGVPSKAMDADVSDAHQRHLHQVVARYTAPVVRFAMRAVPNPDPQAQGRGFLLIAVPRSPHAPHAITAPLTKKTKEVLLYPRRAASKTDWLTETDVATAYLRRFTAAADRIQRLATAERELLAALPPSNAPHLIVSLTPEVPGEMTINRDTFDRHREELRNTTMLADAEPLFTDVHIGSRRLIASGGQPHGLVYAQGHLHRDGTGSLALRLPPRVDTDDNKQFHWVELDTLVWSLRSALHVLGGHARDRTGATSTAILKAAVVDAPHSHPQGPPKPNMHPHAAPAHRHVQRWNRQAAGPKHPDLRPRRQRGRGAPRRPRRDLIWFDERRLPAGRRARAGLRYCRSRSPAPEPDNFAT